VTSKTRFRASVKVQEVTGTLPVGAVVVEVLDFAVPGILTEKP
jgi:hypothetical protein